MKLLLPTLIAFPAIALASGPYSQTTVVPWKPKNATSVDVSTVVNGIYYLSDRTNGIVHIVDLSSATETGSISGFVGLTLLMGHWISQRPVQLAFSESRAAMNYTWETVVAL